MHYLLGGRSVQYRSLAVMLVVRVPDAQGGEVYLKGVGKLLPQDADPQHLEELLERGMIEKVAV
jgi:hypothetical protein